MNLGKNVIIKTLENILRKIYIFYLRYISNKFLFEVQLADHCNLNCIGCSHFSSIADEHFLDIDSYKKDCTKLSEIAKNHVALIHLCGGEPLLHNHIVEIIKITRLNFDKAIIKIITNGILLPNMEADFWNTCKDSNIIISITTYPININTKRIYELSLQYNIIIENNQSPYTMKFRKDVLDNEGSQNPKKSFRKCERMLCHQLYKGKIYMCQVPAYIKYINQYFSKNFKISSDDYINIYEIKDVKKLFNYFHKPIQFCKYCNIEAVDNNIIWDISKKEMSEWM